MRGVYRHGAERARRDGGGADEEQSKRPAHRCGGRMAFLSASAPYVDRGVRRFVGKLLQASSEISPRSREQQHNRMEENKNLPNFLRSPMAKRAVQAGRGAWNPQAPDKFWQPRVTI